MEARRKAHNKPINNLSGLVHAEGLHDLSPRNEEKQYERQIQACGFKSSPLLTNVERLFRQTNS